MNTRDINSWAHFDSWQSVTPPSRPDGWQLDIIRRTIKDIPVSGDIAVLGSTIEFRTLLAGLGYRNVFVFERNQSFYEYISAYMQSDYSETFVSGNWLDTLFDYPNRFALILSDLTSGNLNYSSRSRFYQGIAQALLPEGIFIDRILTKPCPFIPLEKLLEKYGSLEVSNATVNLFNCEVLFCSTLLDNDQNIVDSNAFYDRLLNLSIPRISEFVQACYEITPRDCLWWYSKPWNSEKKVYETYLKILQAYDEPRASAYHKRCQLLISRRKDGKSDE